MRFAPPPKDSFHEDTLFSCFVGKRVRDASIYVSKKYRSSFYSRAIATIATNVTMLQCYMLHVTCYISKRVRDATLLSIFQFFTFAARI